MFDREDNFIEHNLADLVSKEDIIIKFRDNVFGIKTLNTDMISKKLTLERVFERKFIQTLEELENSFDYIFIDLPPSSNRASEIVLELCHEIILIVELNKLGVNGFYNTLQYFTDYGIEFNKVKYVLPNGFSKMKSVPSVALDEIIQITNDNLKEAIVLEPFPEKANIQTLQQKGIVVFDKDVTKLNYYQRTQKKILEDIFTNLYKSIKI